MKLIKLMWCTSLIFHSFPKIETNWQRQYIFQSLLMSQKFSITAYLRFTDMYYISRIDSRDQLTFPWKQNWCTCTAKFTHQMPTHGFNPTLIRPLPNILQTYMLILHSGNNAVRGLQFIVHSAWEQDTKSSQFPLQHLSRFKDLFLVCLSQNQNLAVIFKVSADTYVFRLHLKIHIKIIWTRMSNISEHTAGVDQSGVREIWSDFCTAWLKAQYLGNKNCMSKPKPSAISTTLSGILKINYIFSFATHLHQKKNHIDKIVTISLKATDCIKSIFFTQILKHSK